MNAPPHSAIFFDRRFFLQPRAHEKSTAPPCLRCQAQTRCQPLLFRVRNNNDIHAIAPAFAVIDHVLWCFPALHAKPAAFLLSVGRWSG